MHNAPFFLKYRLHHLVFWMLVFGVWFFLRADEYSRQSTAFKVTAIKVADLALMIYITNYVLIPRLLYKKKYGWFALGFVLLILTSSIIKMYILGRVTHNPALYDWSSDIKRRVYDNILPHFFLVIAGAAVKLVFDYRQLQQRMAETAKEKAEAELNFLKSQINPHFVFNSLNSVYFLINKDNSDARNALHKFSEILRYQLYEMNGEKVPVEKEIRYLKDYMDLQQLRKDDKYAVEFHCADSVKGFSIEPLLLIPLVENAFKHISHHRNGRNYVEVKMQRENGQFLFTVKNSKEHQPTTESHGGIGLQNVKRRLELLYPGKHDFKVSETAVVFTVSLNIRLS
ncbi:MAG: GHKL domain-containing protein [Bacteroidetes bacterium]|nr:GHKL domain-containing protein [Bacteroidota bacterium]